MKLYNLASAGFFIAKNLGGKMALSLLAANNAQTVLAAGISSTATSLTVNTGTGTLFPSPVTGTSFFKLTIIDAATGSLTEIVHVTARNGDVFTIQRGQEGTVARAWSANDIAANMMTAGTLSYILGNFQPLDPTLTALAALVGVANKLPYFNGNDTAALTDLTQVGRDIIGKSTIADILTYLGLQTIRPDPRSTKIYSPDLKKFLMVSDTIWGMWNGESNTPVALTIEQGGTGETTVDGVKTAFGIDKLQPKGEYADKSAETPQIFSDAIKAKYGLEIKDASEIGSVSLYAANNEASIHGWSGQKITIPDKAGTMALAGESVTALRLSSPREVTVTSSDAWVNFTTSEMVVGLYITPTPGNGPWVLNKVRVATLQANINGAWVNVTQ
ncbi:TPA: hypothetical protein ACPVE0_001065 [Escherichia coli]